MNLYDRLLSGDATLSVVGLGYVGLPIALAFARKVRVIGFDINAERVEQMRRGIDPSGELPSEAFAGCDITFNAVWRILVCTSAGTSGLSHRPIQAVSSSTG